MKSAGLFGGWVSDTKSFSTVRGETRDSTGMYQMLISVKHNFAVLLTPKCASNAVEDALVPYSEIVLRGIPALRHTDYRTYSKYIKPYLKCAVGDDNVETTCLVREPLSWLNSHYRFRSRLEIRNSKSDTPKASTFGISFADFIEAYMSPDPPPYARFRSQFDFVKNDSNEIGVETIFAYEQIDRFFEFISDRVGKKLSTSYRNVSPRMGNERKIAAWLDFAERKVTGRFGWRRRKSQSVYDYQVPDPLLRSLREFIPEDFALYEKVSKERK